MSLEMNEAEEKFLEKLDSRFEESRLLLGGGMPVLLAPIARIIGLNTARFLISVSFLVAWFLWVWEYGLVWEILRWVFLYD